MGKDEREFFPFWLKFHLHLRKSEEHFTGRQSQDEKEDIENENNTIRRPADADNTCTCVIDKPKQVETDLGGEWEEVACRKQTHIILFHPKKCV